MRPEAKPKAASGMSSTTTTAITTGVAFDIIDYLTRAAFAARTSAVCQRQAGAPSNREEHALLVGVYDREFHLRLVSRKLAFSF